MVDGLFAHEQIDRSQITGIVMGSVVPPLTAIWRRWRSGTSALTRAGCRPDDNTGMPILYKNPAEVGADRIANAVAAFEQLRPRRGRPLIVVDLGTATTFDAVTAKGEYLGGVICPGPADRRRSAVSACRAAAARRRAQAADGDRPDDRRRDRVRAVLRLRRAWSRG